MKFKISPFLKFVYFIAKSLTRTSFKIFYRKKTILNEQYLKIDSPTILVSNHPSTLTDPLNAAKHVDAVVYFLANAGLFKNKTVGNLLSTFYCIPVERPVDVGGRRINNADTFKKCYDFLKRGGTLYIAPEGGSKLVRRIRKLKTGTARIALNAEAEYNFDLGIKILPVGINYAAPKKFRSDLIINVGKPIFTKTYQEAFQEDPIPTARKMTKDLYFAMQELVLHTEEDEEDIDKLVQKLQHIFRTEHGLSFKEEFFWAKKLIKYLRQAKGSEAYDELLSKTEEYCNLLTKQEIQDEDLFVEKEPIKNSLFTFFGFLPAVFGYLNNFIFYHVPKSIVGKEGFYKGYTSTIYIMFGIVILPILYLIYFIVITIFSSAIIAVLYLILAFTMGLFAAHYFKKLKVFARQKKCNQFKSNKPDEFLKLKELRAELVRIMDQLMQLKGKAPTH